MPTFLPFRGVRYNASVVDVVPDDLAAVTAPPYDVVDDDARVALEARHPRNPVRLILPRDGDGADRYSRAADDLRGWQAEGALVRDPAPRFYRYRMRFVDEDGGERETLGVLGALGVADVGPPTGVLPHERTMPKARSDRLELLRSTRANLDPIWGLAAAPGLSARLESPVAPLARAVDEDGTEHMLDAIDDPTMISAISDAVAGNAIVLADGHHRFETARAFLDESGAPGAGAILALIVELADDQLCVRAIHRLLSGLGRFDLRAGLTGSFTVVPVGTNTPEEVDALRARMVDEHALGLVDHDGLALLVPDENGLAGGLTELAEPVRHTDAARFDAGVVPVVPATTEIGYRNDANTVAALVDKGAADAAVLLRPVTVPDIEAAAAVGARMPQKTSFFHPKPRTGMVFRLVDRLSEEPASDAG